MNLILTYFTVRHILHLFSLFVSLYVLYIWNYGSTVSTVDLPKYGFGLLVLEIFLFTAISVEPVVG